VLKIGTVFRARELLDAGGVKIRMFPLGGARSETFQRRKQIGRRHAFVNLNHRLGSQTVCCFETAWGDVATNACLDSSAPRSSRGPALLSGAASGVFFGLLYRTILCS
jgi:hypothetical protein